jgi:hypothetical protein
MSWEDKVKLMMSKGGNKGGKKGGKKGKSKGVKRDSDEYGSKGGNKQGTEGAEGGADSAQMGPEMGDVTGHTAVSSATGRARGGRSLEGALASLEAALNRPRVFLHPKHSLHFSAHVLLVALRAQACAMRAADGRAGGDWKMVQRHAAGARLCIETAFGPMVATGERVSQAESKTSKQDSKTNHGSKQDRKKHKSVDKNGTKNDRLVDGHYPGMEFFAALLQLQQLSAWALQNGCYDEVQGEGKQSGGKAQLKRKRGENKRQAKRREAGSNLQEDGGRHSAAVEELAENSRRACGVFVRHRGAKHPLVREGRRLLQLLLSSE